MIVKDELDAIGIKPAQILVIFYVIVKQLFFFIFVEPQYWLGRGIASLLMVAAVFFLTGRKKLTNRHLAVLVPVSVAFIEIVLCAIVGGDRLIYTFLFGCVIFSLMFIDIGGLTATVISICTMVGFCAFVLKLPMLGGAYTMEDEIFSFTGMLVLDIIVVLIGAFSVSTLTRYRQMGRIFNTMMNNTPNYIAVVNDKATVEHISQSIVDMLDIDSREAANQQPFLDLLPTGELKQLFSDFLHRGGSLEDTFELTIDGKPHWFMLRSLEVEEKGAARFLEWMDITAIVEAQKSAEAAARVKSDFLAKMSHEIRTPMNAIIGITELILRDTIPPRIREHAMSIKSAGNNLLSIINDILDFSKIESGRMEIFPGEYHFSSLINDVINIIQIKSAEKSIIFTVNLQSSIPRQLIGDEVRLRQILLNLLSNAVKYTDKGFVDLSVGGEFNDDHTFLLNIQVSDSGKGIKPEDLNKLFEYFVQVDMVQNKEVQGTGLGLAITKNLCQAMGGDVSVCSEYGVGSTFTAQIPQGVAENSGDGYQHLATVENPQEKSVLLFKANEIYADSIIQSLEGLGVFCGVVQNLDELSSALQHSKYPFVFVASLMFERVREIIDELGVSPTLVLLTEYGESISENNIKTIAMPAHSMSIANILNDITDNAGYGERIDIGVVFSAPAARVLVVDDIATNLKVAEGLMAPYNMQIDTCLSGAAALEIIQKQQYDIVFMDHMMPEMDGIETARRIRAMVDKYYADLPIVALTANAMSGAAEMFLQNGMSDFLSKPIETAKLGSILDKWIPAHKKERPLAWKEKPAPPQIEIEGMDANAGLIMAGADIRRYMSTLSVFCKDSTEKLEQIRQCMEAADMRLYITYVHAMKSALYNIGARELSERAKNLELAGMDGDLSYIRQNTTHFLQDLGALIDHIEQASADFHEKARQEKAEEKLDRELLKSLKNSLSEMDAQTSGDIITALQALNMSKQEKEAIEHIYQYFLLFEYDAALAAIDVLLANE